MRREPPRVLVVEDEIPLAKGIGENLEAEGFDVELVHDGLAALERMRRAPLDLVVLDVMLPEMDGFEVCETARREGNEVPILFLTAKGTVDDRIRGLEAGASDYLPKPFHLRELLLRAAAIVRRPAPRGTMAGAGADTTGPRKDLGASHDAAGDRPLADRIRFGDNEVDSRSQRARGWDGSECVLSEREALLLDALCEREGEIVSREEILDRVWRREVLPSSRAIDALVRRLQSRFEPDPEHPRHFHTVHGIGYRFTREPEA